MLLEVEINQKFFFIFNTSEKSRNKSVGDSEIFAMISTLTIIFDNLITIILLCVVWSFFGWKVKRKVNKKSANKKTRIKVEKERNSKMKEIIYCM